MCIRDRVVFAKFLLFHLRTRFCLFSDHSWLSCSLEKCSRRSSGTATVALELNNISDGRKLFFDRYSNNDRLCYCRCLPNTPIFREDLHICVNDLHGKVITVIVIKSIFLNNSENE